MTLPRKSPPAAAMGGVLSPIGLVWRRSSARDGAACRPETRWATASKWRMEMRRRGVGESWVVLRRLAMGDKSTKTGTGEELRPALGRSQIATDEREASEAAPSPSRE